MERLFVAVWPPAAVVGVVDDVVLGDGVRRVRPERLHVTVRFLGDADAEEVVAALDGATLPAATAAVGGPLAVLGRDALVVPVGGLEVLAGAIADVTGHLGLAPRQPFRGHLTVGRLRRGRPPVGTVAATSFAVASIDLVRSMPGGAAGPTYTTLRTWSTARP